jgi:hypothetical protein
MKQETTKPYASYKPTNLVNYLNESGTGTLSQTFMPSYLNEPKGTLTIGEEYSSPSQNK